MRRDHSSRRSLRTSPATAEEVRAMVDSGAPVQIIDTRPKHYISRSAGNHGWCCLA